MLCSGIVMFNMMHRLLIDQTSQFDYVLTKLLQIFGMHWYKHGTLDPNLD
jgi:hypothetical protein